MKLKDFLSAIVKNKNNKQLNASFKKTKLKEHGISVEDLLNVKIDTKLKMLLEK